MKKLLYFLFAFAVIAFSSTSCADEEIAPSSELYDNGGGNANPGGIG